MSLRDIVKKRLGHFFRSIAGFFGVHLIRVPKAVRGVGCYPIKIRPAEPRYVNVGAGAFRHPLWHNFDKVNDFYSWGQNIDIHHDLLSDDPFPLRSGSVDVFYVSHVLEHLTDESSARLMAEVHRCLRPGGLFRIVTPDAALLYSAYERNDRTFWLALDPWSQGQRNNEYKLVENLATCLVLKGRFPDLFWDAERVKRLYETTTMEEFFETLRLCVPMEVNRVFPEGHINWFTAEKLVQRLARSGFARVRKSAFMQSDASILRDPRLFDNTCPDFSVYVEALK